MIVAPNSPSDRAQVMTRPAARAARAMRDRDPPEQVELARAVDAGGVLELARHAAEARPRGADEERRRDEDLGEDDGEGRERDRDPEHRPQRLAEQPASPEHEEQAEAGDRGRQHDRQVDDGLEQAGAPEPPARQHDRQRQPEADRDDEADRGRDQAELEGVEDGRARERVRQRALGDRPDDEDGDREAEEQGEQAGDDPERQLPRGDAPGSRWPCSPCPQGRGVSAWLLAPAPSVTRTGAAGTRSSTGSPGRQGRRTRSGTSRRRPGSGTP